MFNCTIKIAGPGLIVNTPAEIVIRALIEAGFNVEFNEWDGQERGYNKSVSDQNITVEVKALPWGG